MLDAKQEEAPPPLSERSPSPANAGEDRWCDYVVPQEWESFTAEDHAVWDLLFARQVELLGSRVVSPFLDGIDLLRLRPVLLERLRVDHKRHEAVVRADADVVFACNPRNMFDVTDQIFA